MSLAGLGLSLGESAQARNAPEPAPRGTAPLGLRDLQGEVDGNAADTATAATAFAEIAAGPLDVTLSWPGSTPALSAEDRAAVALAMVLMAESPPSELSSAMPNFVVSAWPQEPDPAFLRGIQNVSSQSEPTTGAAEPGAVVAGATLEPSAAAERRVNPESALAPGPARFQDTKAPIAVAAVDLDLSGWDAARARFQDTETPFPVAAVDLDLSGWDAAVPPPTASDERFLGDGWALDLNLDLSPGLDLNLDLAPEVDLALDRPPVFPATRLKPLGSAARPDASAVVCTADEPLLLRDLPLPAARPLQLSAPVQAAIIAAAPPQVRLAPEPTVEAPPKVAVIDATPKIAPTIVVASHTDRVLRSLEVMLGHDDPAAAHLSPGAEEVFVTSHAEKVLRTLASTCAGERAAPAADDLRHLSKVASPEPAGACPATATLAKAVRPARSSAIGAGAVALSQSDLDKVRGGFETSNGLTISFGIERAVYINGALVTTTSLNLSDLGKITGGTGVAGAAVAGSSNLTLIQNGPGNTFVSGPVSAATVGTIVQNTLNDQKIQSVTAINATVNSLQLVRAQNFQSTLRSALIDSLRR